MQKQTKIAKFRKIDSYKISISFLLSLKLYELPRRKVNGLPPVSGADHGGLAQRFALDILMAQGDGFSMLKHLNVNSSNRGKLPMITYEPCIVLKTAM